MFVIVEYHIMFELQWQYLTGAAMYTACKTWSWDSDSKVIVIEVIVIQHTLKISSGFCRV